MARASTRERGRIRDSRDGAAPEHPRTMGWFGTCALAMGGSNQSLFLIGALVLSQGTGAVPLLVIGLLLSWAAMPGWIELVLMWPKRVGGIAATCAEAFRPYSPVLANLTGVCYWWGWIPTCGLTALLSAAALHEWYLPFVSVPLLATVIVALFTAINLCGVRWVTRLAIPIACASAALAFGSALIPVLAGNVDWQQASSFDLKTPFAGVFGGLTSAMAGLYLIGFAAPGFEAAACHVGEMKDPVRNLPRAMFASAGVASLYFVALPVIWLGVLGSGPIEGELMRTLGPTFAPLLGSAAKSAAIWFMVLNMFHGTLQPLAGASRTLSQLSEDGLLPRMLARRSRFDVGDNLRKVNALVRYSQGDAVNGFALTGMGYRGTWNSTDQIPRRAVAEGIVGRFGTLDPTDGGDTYRYSGLLEWQRTRGNASTKVTAYGLGYNLNLFSNFTFFLDDRVHGDQFHQADQGFVTGAKVAHRRLARWGGRSVQNTFGVQVRNDDITKVGLYHTEARRLIDVTRQDAVLQTSGAIYAQNEIEWTPWLRTLAGIRADGYRFQVDAGDPLNSGTVRAGLASPKGGVVIGPFSGTELYANAGAGFHSNDARGATITVDPTTGAAADRVTALVRAKGAEIGFRTVAIPHLQTSVALWALSLDSELIFVGDAGTTEPGRPSHRHGVEIANYYSPLPWLTFDADLSVSRAHFTDADPVGVRIPGSVQTVVSAGATVDSVHNIFGSVRLRYFGPRPLVEDDSVQSKATSLANLEVGYRLAKSVKIGIDVFNLFNAADSDVDYFYTSRLPGEPAAGFADMHFHPTLPRTVRLSLTVGF